MSPAEVRALVERLAREHGAPNHFGIEAFRALGESARVWGSVAKALPHTFELDGRQVRAEYSPRRDFKPPTVTVGAA